MGAKKGSNNGVVGKKKRSGRKSAYREMADANFLWNIFKEARNEEELKKLITDQKKKHSIKDVWIAKSFLGNERFIKQMVDKLFPDKIKADITTDGEPLGVIYLPPRNKK